MSTVLWLFYDRYALPLVVMMVALALGSAGIARRGLAVLGVALLATVSGIGTWDHLQYNRAFWNAVTWARQAGIDASDPLPADTLFGKAARGAYDGVVALYHDQGLIPLKLVAFGTCVNMTVGLPIIRTSVDHGTAYDIAGRGVAEPGSLIEAIKLAVQLVRIRRQAAPKSSRRRQTTGRP